MFPDFSASLMGTSSLVPSGAPDFGNFGGVPNMDFGSSGGGGFLGGASPVSAGLAGLQTLGALWGAWQQNKMAKKQFKFTKDITNTNLANQIKSYNTALFDRARSRGVMESQSQGEIDAYVNNNSLSRSSTGAHKSDAYTHNYGNGSAAPILAGSMGSGGVPTGSSSLSGMGAALASRAASERSNRDDEPATRG